MGPGVALQLFHGQDLEKRVGDHYNSIISFGVRVAWTSVLTLTSHVASGKTPHLSELQ